MLRPRIALLITLTLGLLMVSLAAGAQQAAHVYRIGRLSSGHPPAGPDPNLEAFRQGLRTLVYDEGQNLVIEYRYAEGHLDRLPALAAELVRLQVDVLVAVASAAIRAAQQATRTIPIVMAGGSDPVGAGLVASLARPGGSITGFSNLTVELPEKRMKLLKAAVPQGGRVAVLANPANPNYTSTMHDLTRAAQALGLHLRIVELRRPDELDAAFAAVTRAGADALLMVGEPLLVDSLRGRTVDLAAKHRLPAMYSWRELVMAGGLMSYGPSLPDMHRRVATYVDKILKGTKPADLPVE